MNSIDARLERLRARLSGAKKNARKERHFRVMSGNVTVFIVECDQGMAAKSFAKLMMRGKPFDNSALGELMQIKDLKSDMTWYAHTMSMLSAAAA